jgi:hypothetical protein
MPGPPRGDRATTPAERSAAYRHAQGYCGGYADEAAGCWRSAQSTAIIIVDATERVQAAEQERLPLPGPST